LDFGVPPPPRVSAAARKPAPHVDRTRPGWAADHGARQQQSSGEAPDWFRQHRHPLPHKRCDALPCRRGELSI